jgi:FO synthase
MTAAVAPAHTAFLRALDRAALGRGVSREEAGALIRAEDGALADLARVAADLRDRGRGRTITYSPKVFIPLTNICRDYCKYCTFRRDPGDPGAEIMTIEQVLAVARAGQRLGCQEALFSLGDQPERIFPEVREALRRLGHATILSYLREACAAVLDETTLLPHANPGLMTAPDLERLRPVNASMGLMLENASDRLLRPGGAHHGAPDKVPRLRLRTIAEAGRLKIAFTTGILIGIGETLEERVDSLFAIRDLHERYGHIQEVIVQNFRAKPDIPMRHHPEPTEADMIRTIAVARCILGPAMSIQAPPNLTPRGYPAYLRAGINDWGGISPLTRDFINPEAPWPHVAELARHTAEAGLVLRQRLAIYPEYIARHDGYVPESLRERIRARVDSRGYPREES